MNTISYTYARSHLAETINKVIGDHAPIKITLGNDKRVILISEEDYNSLDETSYLLSSPKNAERLLRSVKWVKEQIAKTPCAK